ncbi:MAG: glycosyltransferase family 1 protein [Mucinivorans sp.]
MKIAIEAQRIFRANKHGMDFVALESIRQLQKIDQANEYFIFVSPGADHCLQESANVHIIEVHCPTYPLWEQVALPRAVAKVKPDLLHCTSNTAPRFGNTPLVLTLHDIIFLEKKDGVNKSFYQNLGWYYRRWLVPHIVPLCQKIITVSKTEYTNICAKLKFDTSRLSVIHNGVSDQYKLIENPYLVTKKYCKTPKYLLFFGSTDPRKNTIRTLKAYKLYTQKSQNALPLIITGLSEEAIDTILSENQIDGIKDKLIYPGYISGEDLPYLYNGAFAFICASLREGFGIPVLESMACGTPVITSNLSSMPEVAGQDAILVDPTDQEEIAAKLILLEQSPDFYNQQVKYGLERAKLFSWEQTARSLLDIYTSIKGSATGVINK